MARIAGDKDYYSFVLRGADGRYHRDIEIRLPSVTTILKILNKPQLVPWASRVTRDVIAGLAEHFAEQGQLDDFYDLLTDPDMLAEYLKENRLRPEDVRDDAAERGRSEHDFLERLATAEMRDEEVAQRIAQRALNAEASTGYTRAIAGWWLDTNPRVIQPEQMVYNLTDRYAGSLDLLWVDTGGYTVLTDLKTGNENRKPYDSDHIQCQAYADALLDMDGTEVDRTSVLIARENGTFTEEYADLPDGTFRSVLEAWKKVKGVN